MSESENRQLAIAAGVALLVLGGGAFFWFGQAGSPPPAEPVDVTGVGIKPTAPSGGLTTETAAPDRRREAPLPTMVPGLKHPRVRPPEAEPALYAALTAIEPAFQACYDAALKERPGAKGRALLQFNVDGGALASEVAVELRSIPSTTLRDCLGAATPTADFSEVSGLARVIWPLLMWPDKGLSVQAPVTPLDGD